MSKVDLRKVISNTLFTWFGLVIVTLSASFLYAFLGLVRMNGILQIGLSFTFMLILFVSMYPPIELNKKIWISFWKQVKEIFLTNEGWSLALLLPFIVMIIFMLVMVIKGSATIIQMSLFLFLITISFLFCGQWWDWLGSVWNRWADYEKWNNKYKIFFMMIPTITICWLLWPFRSPADHQNWWSLFGVAICLLVALPLFVSPFAFIYILVEYNSILLEKISENIKILRETFRWKSFRQIMFSSDERVSIVRSLGLTFGIALLLMITLPIAVISIVALYSTKKT